jgi:hypothetical protein
MTDKLDQVRLLSNLARGLVSIYDAGLNGIQIRSPYPVPLERGMHQLAALQISVGETPVAGLQDVFNLARQPLGTWGLDFDETLIGTGSDALIVRDKPTDLCLEWASQEDAEALFQTEIMREVFELCIEQDIPQSYTAFRKLLIEHQVLTTLERQRLKRQPELKPLREVLMRAYHPAPRSAIEEGNYWLCAYCGGLMLRDRDGFACENMRCAGYGRGAALSADDEVLWLDGGLRRYISRPGLPEIKLQEALAALGLTVTLWPAFDAYDLHFVVNGSVWAVDVKDWSNPYLLGSKLSKKAIPGPQKWVWDRAFYVFPDDRSTLQQDYLRAFESRWQAPARTIALMMSDFIDMVTREIKKGRQNA